MSERIPLLDPDNAPAPVRETFVAVKAKIGMVPNLYRVMGQSPAALNAYLSMAVALETASLVEKRGWIDDAELAAVRTKGLTDGEILEVVALVAQTTFSNYTNHVAHTPIDFPQAEDLPHN